MLALLLWGLLKPRGLPEPFAQASSLLHFTAFFGYALAARYALDRITGWVLWTVLLLSAPALEYLQSLVQPATRLFSMLDIAGNTVGVALALLLWPVLRPRLLPPPT